MYDSNVYGLNAIKMNNIQKLTLAMINYDNAICAVRKNIFKTKSGLKILDDMFNVNNE